MRLCVRISCVLCAFGWKCVSWWLMCGWMDVVCEFTDMIVREHVG